MKPLFLLVCVLLASSVFIPISAMPIQDQPLGKIQQLVVNAKEKDVVEVIQNAYRKQSHRLITVKNLTAGLPECGKAMGLWMICYYVYGYGCG
ncbi:hypothetical protein J1N35_023643 [Gossypium stocksii]|uniref:Cystatin domain-containing protein n=1 Tax=Gossypium stocksii TaxID=47602 RepID=A0A9D3VKA5_9ROSI|nr:hypothetical protein J1N35_023643 [Gossypium stocksii]